jgi:hypothetical protein
VRVLKETDTPICFKTKYIITYMAGGVKLLTFAIRESRMMDTGLVRHPLVTRGDEGDKFGGCEEWKLLKTKDLGGLVTVKNWINSKFYL